MNRTAWIAALLACAAVAPLPAQKPYAATYDDTRQVRLEGPVTRIEWINPRAFLFVEVRDAAGVTTRWSVDIGNPLELERDGWKRSAVRLGDVVTVEAVPAAAATPQAFAKSVVLKTGGRRLFTSAARRAPSSAAPAPRWPDGQVRLGPPEGGRGYWSAPTATALVERSAAKVPMTNDGLLLNLSDADRVAPFQPWAKALYLYRQRTRLKDDPIGRCLPPGGPRQFHTINGFQLVEQRQLGRILVLLGGGNRNWRIIHTDGRPQTPSAEMVLTYYGNSVGRWEKDTLIVDSAGYNERFWLSAGGLPHTEALHLVERFTRPNLNTLRYDVTVDDPRTYTRTWSGGWDLQWIADRDIDEFFCEEKLP